MRALFCCNYQLFSGLAAWNSIGSSGCVLLVKFLFGSLTVRRFGLSSGKSDWNRLQILHILSWHILDNPPRATVLSYSSLGFRGTHLIPFCQKTALCHTETLKYLKSIRDDRIPS